MAAEEPKGPFYQDRGPKHDNKRPRFTIPPHTRFHRLNQLVVPLEARDVQKLGGQIDREELYKLKDELFRIAAHVSTMLPEVGQPIMLELYTQFAELLHRGVGQRIKAGEDTVSLHEFVLPEQKYLSDKAEFGGEPIQIDTRLRTFYNKALNATVYLAPTVRDLRRVRVEDIGARSYVTLLHGSFIKRAFAP